MISPFYKKLAFTAAAFALLSLAPSAFAKPIYLSNEGDAAASMPALGKSKVAPPPAPMNIAPEEDEDVSLPPASSSPMAGGARPVSARGYYWDVKQSSMPAGFYEQGAAAPCVATKKQMMNGLVQVSAGNHKVYALTFEAGEMSLSDAQNVPVTVGFEGDVAPIALSAQVVTPTALSVHFPDPVDTYTRLEKSGLISVMVQTKKGVAHRLYYDVTGIRTALADLEKCTTTQQVALNAARPVAAKTSEGMSASILPGRVRKDQAELQGKALPPPIWPGEKAETIAATPVPARSALQVPDAVKTSGKTVSVEPKPALSSQGIALQETLQREQPRVIAMPGVSVSNADGASASLSAPRLQLTVKGPAPIPTPAAPMKAVSVPVSAAPVPVKISESYRARLGESLRDVLRRWADREGIDLVWDMRGDIPLKKEFSYVGTFSDAVRTLLAAYPEAGIKTTLAPQGVAIDKKPYIDSSGPPAVPPVPVAGAPLDAFAPTQGMTDRDVAMVPTLPPDFADPLTTTTPRDAVKKALPPPPPPVNALPSAADVSAPVTRPALLPPSLPAAAPAAVGPTKRWRALSGASMKQVMQAWSEEAGITLVWLSRNDYVVRYSLNKKADYGAAVADLLGQYNFETTRPMGQLYQDPQTGDKTLVVR